MKSLQKSFWKKLNMSLGFMKAKVTKVYGISVVSGKPRQKALAQMEFCIKAHSKMLCFKCLQVG